MIHSASAYTGKKQKYSEQRSACIMIPPLTFARRRMDEWTHSLHTHSARTTISMHNTFVYSTHDEAPANIPANTHIRKSQRYTPVGYNKNWRCRRFNSCACCISKKMEMVNMFDYSTHSSRAVTGCAEQSASGPSIHKFRKCTINSKWLIVDCCLHLCCGVAHTFACTLRPITYNHHYNNENAK